MNECTHTSQIHEVTPNANGCEECLQTGDTWVHLRMCLTCGHFDCCDSSRNKHAIKHFHATNHPIVQSQKPGESWRFCSIRPLARVQQNKCLRAGLVPPCRASHSIGRGNLVRRTSVFESGT